MSTEAALLTAVAADPDDDTARLVYADYLEEKGGEGNTARAQFIRAQIELARPPRRGESGARRELLATAKRLQKQYGAEWAAPVFDAAGTKNDKYWRELSYDGWERGFRNWMSFESLADLRARAPAVLALNPITGLSVRKFDDADVRALINEPLVRTVIRLNLCGGGWGETRISFGDETAAALAASPNLARLEELDLTQNRLTTEGVRVLAHSPVLTCLKRLRLYGNEINDGTYEMLARSPLGARMTAWLVDGSAGVTSEAAGILMGAKHLTHIEVLSFDNTSINDSGVEALTASSHLASVRELDFRNTNITAAAVQRLARARVFANLERLNLVKTWIGTPGANALCRSKYLTKIKFLALYSAVPESAEKKLRERFGRKVEFGRI
ncbi:TIGR02996 domain-containing protein [Gemmata sp. JC673]|uniref:TIGR02996 domain-containing protein n=1 Tax=Gemmata algarum TaxID=2975278 RepID=A0ABU5EV80_9BACT|nr:TIGR02996 domain-containing protein [Gemmata algarum]MDY3559206.1 TIGR02996 domain-containing protein [Gemmata algarum]